SHVIERDQSAVFLECVCDPSGDLAPIKRLDGIGVGKRLKHSAQVGIAKSIARLERFAILQQQFGNAFIFSELLRSGADRARKAFRNWKPVLRKANGRRDELPKRPSSITSQRQL